MKKLFFLIAFMIATTTLFAQTSTYVSGYTKSNGTYVQGYYRTTPNSTTNDNYSTVGNTNPYTGATGTKPRVTNYSTYSSGSSSYSYTPSNSTTRTIYTGPRGGQYYINSSGNKTYISN